MLSLCRRNLQLCCLCVGAMFSCAVFVSAQSSAVLSLCRRNLQLCCLCVGAIFSCAVFVSAQSSAVLSLCRRNLQLCCLCVGAMFSCAVFMSAQSSAVLSLCEMLKLGCPNDLAITYTRHVSSGHHTSEHAYNEWSIPLLYSFEKIGSSSVQF